MQVLRRGGLRNGPKVNPQEVDGRVAQLRAQAKEEQASKIEPGATAQGKAKARPKAKAKEKAGWAVPEDYQCPVTQLEHELGNLTEGPDYSWHHQFRQDTEITAVQAGTGEAQKRRDAYEKLLSSKKLAPLSGCSDHLHSHVASHFINAGMQGREVQLAEVLTQAIDYGHPQLAEEAQEVLSSLGAKTGLTLPEPEAHFDAFTWAEGIGKSQITFGHPLWEGVPPLSILDAQDKLALPDDLRDALQLGSDRAEETRQCLCLHVALAFEEDLSTAWERARDLRRELWEESSAAFQHLGDASPYISTAEAAFITLTIAFTRTRATKRIFGFCNCLRVGSCRVGFLLFYAFRTKGLSRLILSEVPVPLKPMVLLLYIEATCVQHVALLTRRSNFSRLPSTESVWFGNLKWKDGEAF